MLQQRLIMLIGLHLFILTVSPSKHFVFICLMVLSSVFIIKLLIKIAPCWTINLFVLYYKLCFGFTASL